MVLKLRDHGDAVKSLQRGLNKVGSLLLIDGDFGPGTRDAVVDARVALGLPGEPEADEAFQAALEAVPDPFPRLTAAGVTFIAREEVSSADLYRRLYRRPIWPGGESGITIGIGYDLRFVDGATLKDDWGAHLPPEALLALTPALGKPGSTALLARVRDAVDAPLAAAMTVLVRRSLPTYIARARGPYPQIDQLPPARQAALASLVYNRGAGLKDDKPPERENRREMREIQRLLAAGRVEDVADQIDAMVRLWDPATAAGLITRRRREAILWRAGFAALQLV
jgi:hypothetical protein